MYFKLCLDQFVATTQGYIIFFYDIYYYEKPCIDDRDDKSSVFEEVLRPRFRPDSNNKRKAIQIEIHVFLSPKEIKASILLNKLRLIGIFDLIMELKSFVFDKIPENSGEEDGK